MYRLLSHNDFHRHGKKLALGLPDFVFAQDPDGEGSPLPQGQAAQPVKKNLPPDINLAAGENEILQTVENLKKTAAALENFVPSKIEAVYSGSDERAQYEAKWNAMLKEFNGLQEYADTLRRIQTELKKPEVNIKDYRWVRKVGKLFGQLESLNTALGAGELTPYTSFVDVDNPRAFSLNPETLRIINQNLGVINQNLHNEVNAAVANSVADFEKLRDQILVEMKQEMRKDFDRRLKYLAGAWAQKPPRGFENVKEERVQGIQAAIALLSELTDDADLEEYNSIFNDITMFEETYDFAAETTHAEIKVSDLETEFQNLLDYKKSHIDPVSEATRIQVEEAGKQIDELISTIENNTLYDAEFRAAEVKKLKEIKEEKLQSALDFSKGFDEMLNSEETYKVLGADGKETMEVVEIEIQNSGIKIPAKKGLKFQLEVLKRSDLPESELIKMAKGVQESFKQAQKMMESAAVFKDKELSAFVEQVRQFKSIYKEPPGPGSQGEWLFLAPQDFYRGWEIIKEWAYRRYTRVSTKRIGVFGSKTLRPLENVPYLQTLPNEFDKNIENSEQEEVNHYKGIYGNKDSWQIQDVARTTSNRDEFKACLFLLADLGRIRWDDPSILRQFNNFQTAVWFNVDDISSETANLSRFNEKLRRAVGMWDYGTFNQMDQTNNSNYNGNMNKYNEKAATLAEVPGGLNGRLKDLLKAHKVSGRDAKVDPHEYEGLIRYAIDKGRMSPEARMYFIVQGIAAGIIAFQRASGLNSEFSNRFPVIEYFAAPTASGPKPTLFDIQKVASLDWESNVPGAAFTEWFQAVAMKLKGVKERFNKAVTQGVGIDHDDQGSYLGEISEPAVISLFRTYSDGSRLPETGVQNMTVAMLNWIDTAAHNYNSYPDPKGDMVRFVGAFTRFDGITQGNVYLGDKGWYRWGTSGAQDGVARTHGAYAELYGRGYKGYKDEKMTARQYMMQTKEYIKLLDEDFFTPIYSGSLRTTEDVSAFVRKIEAKYPPGTRYFGEKTGQVKTVDDLFDAVGAYTNFLVTKEPQRVERMLAKVREDHEKFFKHIAEKDKKDSVEAVKAKLGSKESDRAEAIQKYRDIVDLSDSSAGDRISAWHSENDPMFGA